jgi:predicted peptidase
MFAPRLSLVALFLVALSPLVSFALDPQPGKQIATSLEVPAIEGDGKETIHFWLFAPANHAEKEKLPLLVFLHGAGERGTDLEKVKIHGPPKIVDSKADFPFVVISPQCPNTAGRRGWNAKQIVSLIEQATADPKLKVDADQVHLTGLSMGGYGAWAVSSLIPDKLATSTPICGGGDAKNASKLKSLPIWVFHGDKDNAVPLKQSEDMVAALRAEGACPIFTVYAGVGHDSWTATYNSQLLYDWMLANKRKPQM